MAVEVVELAGSRSHGVGYTDGTGRRLYIVRDQAGAEDNISAVVLAVAAVAPFYWNNMSRQEFKAEHQGGNVYLVEVPYKYEARTGGGDGAGSGTLVGVAPDPTQPPGGPGTGPGGSDPSNPPTGPASENDRLYPNVSIEIGGKPPRLYTSRNTVVSGGYGGATVRDYQGLIQVADGKVEGVDVPEPDAVLTQDFTFDYVTWAYLARLKALVWHTNDRPWYTFPAHDVAFLGATIRPDNQGRVVAAMRFGLSNSRVVKRGEIRPGLGRYVEGGPGLPNGNIEVPGWHHLWVTYKPEDDPGIGLRVERPDAFYVEQLLPTDDFRYLGIGG